MRHAKKSLTTVAAASLVAAFALFAGGAPATPAASESPEMGAPVQTASLLVPRRTRLVIKYERVLVA